MSHVDFLWLAAIAGVWYLLGMKRRRQAAAGRHGSAGDLLADGGAAILVWGVVFLVLWVIFH